MSTGVRHFESVRHLKAKKIVNLAAKQGLAKCLTIVPLQTILPPSVLRGQDELILYFMEENQKENDQTQDIAEDLQEFTGMNINSDADIPGNTHLSNPEPENVTDKLQSELDEQKDKYVRLFAEFENYKRRNAKERVELIQTAGREVITSLLDVLDDCDRAEKQMQQTNDITQLKEGIQLVFNKLHRGGNE